MKIKDGVNPWSDDFWYDLAHGGYLAPEKILVNEWDIKHINEAVQLLKKYESLIEERMLEEGEEFEDATF